MKANFKLNFMKTLTILLFLFTSMSLFSQTTPTPAPDLEYVCELRVQLDPPLTVGQTPRGLRRIIPIIGGTVDGPNLKGTIYDGGADWQFIRKDGVAELEAHYQFKTDDGVIIYIKNEALRVATPEVAARIAKGSGVRAPGNTQARPTTARGVGGLGPDGMGACDRLAALVHLEAE